MGETIKAWNAEQGRHRSVAFLDDKSRIADEYRSCLFSEASAGASKRYCKLLTQLLQCQSARVLFYANSSCTEIGRYDRSANLVQDLGCSFCKLVGSETVVANNVDLPDTLSTETSAICQKVAPDIKSYIAAPLQAEAIRLGVLIVVHNAPREWSAEEIEAVDDIARILVANADLRREQHMLTVQKSMQKSLVQFVRGNLIDSARRSSANENSQISKSLYSDLDEDLDSQDIDDETVQVETSRMNVMFDLSARLIRRTLQVSGCVLLNVESFVELENLEADAAAHASIMGACFVKSLRSSEWHENLEMDNQVSIAQGSESTRSVQQETQAKSVSRADVFNAKGVRGEWLKEILHDKPRALFYTGSEIPPDMHRFLPQDVTSCLIAPIFDARGNAFALIVVFDVRVRPFLRYEGHFLEAFSASIYAEVLNQNLQSANESKALFISKISHEFRTPLHGILASAEFLNDMPDVTTSQLGFIQTIDSCGRTLLDIINHVLDYSKLKFGNTTLEQEPVSADNEVHLEEFDLIEVAEQVLQTAYSAYEFKRISEQVHEHKSGSKSASSESSKILVLQPNVEVVIASAFRQNGHLVHADKGAYRRILLNLLGNALRFTVVGHVVVRLEMVPTQTAGLDNLQISVTDTGIGINKSFLGNLFKPFSQEDDFSAGTGLGLSIVKELSVKLHGTIAVKSTKNVGSMFSVTYPVMSRLPEPTLFENNFTRRELGGIQFHFLYDDESSNEAATNTVRDTTIRHLVDWFGMVESSVENAQLLLTDDKLSGQIYADEVIAAFQGPVLTMSSTVVKYEKGLRGSNHGLQSFVAKPCGPIKLGQAVIQCLAQARSISRLEPTMGMLYDRKRSTPLDEEETAFSTGQSVSTVRPSQTNNITGGTRKSVKEEREEQSLADVYEINSARESEFDETDYFRDGICMSPRSPRSPLFMQAPSPRTRRPSYGRSRSFKRPAAATEKTEPEVGSSVQPAIVPKKNHTSGLHLHKDDAKNGSYESSEGSDLGSQKHRRKHVLIVEDNAVNMMLLVRFAQKHNLKVSTAINGALAVEAFNIRTRNFDLVLMDINMPVMNGFQAMSRIRQIEQKRAATSSDTDDKGTPQRDEGWSSPAKIVALTGLSSESDQNEARRRGADDFMTKPIKMKELASLLVDWEIFVPAPEPLIP